jgi:hypothetical protein
MDTTTETRTDRLASLTVWQLARMAGCFDPDADDSPGAEMLARVRTDVIERIEHNPGVTEAEWFADDTHEIADGAPDVYTASRWDQFTDLGAWQESPYDLGADGSDMTGAAGVALYMIAERLAVALFEIAYED